MSQQPYTRKITVNFFQVVPTPDDKHQYNRMAASFKSLDVRALGEWPRRTDYILNSFDVRSHDGLITGAINNAQTGGVMPLRQSSGGELGNVIGPGERLAHLTCFVYDIRRSVLLLESITNGATQVDWCHYFKKHLVNSPTMKAAIIENTSMADILRDFKYITHFEVTVAGFHEDLFKDTAAERSLGEISAIAEMGRAKTVSCVLGTTVKRRNKKKQRPGQESLDPGYLTQLIDKVKGAPTVKRLTMNGIREDSEDVVPLDLLEYRLYDYIQVPVSELSNSANLDIRKRVARLLEVYTKHEGIVSRFDRYDT